MQELKVKMPKGDVVVELNEPTFDQFRGAMLAGETASGKMDKLAVGNFFLVACVTDKDREKLDQVTGDPKAHASAAFEAYSLLLVYDAELKKK